MLGGSTTNKSATGGAPVPIEAVAGGLIIAGRVALAVISLPLGMWAVVSPENMVEGMIDAPIQPASPSDEWSREFQRVDLDEAP